MKISIITLFPEMFRDPFGYSIIKRAINYNLVEINLVNLRDFGTGRHRVVDDKPYGGGAGMILKVDVLHSAIENTKTGKANEVIVLLTAEGKKYNHEIANSFKSLNHLILVCGHYEGIDTRIKNFIDEEISIGDYILSGGEIPAMAIADSVIRLIPGVIKEESSQNESFSKDPRLLDYPQYTSPRIYKGFGIPEVLLSGNHAEIKKWRMGQAKKITQEKRPDLLPQKHLPQSPQSSLYRHRK